MRTPIFVKTYDLLLWLLPQTGRFPKSRRHSLTNRLECAALDFQGAIARANRFRGRHRALCLEEADGLLDQVRFLVRLANDLRCLSDRQYEYVSARLAEVGRLLGAWQSVT